MHPLSERNALERSQGLRCLTVFEAAGWVCAVVNPSSTVDGGNLVPLVGYVN